MHDLLIAKLQAYDFLSESLNFVCNYLLGCKLAIKINPSFSTWLKVEYSAPQGSRLGLLLFNINTLGIFLNQKDVTFAANADNNTPYFCNRTSELLFSKLQMCTKTTWMVFK